MALTVAPNWTQTSVPKTSKPSKRPSGFTLLEVIAALAVMALLIGAVIPQFSTLFTPDHELVFQSLVRSLKVLRNDAVFKNRSYRLVLDEKSRIIELEQLNSKGEYEPIGEDRVLRPIQIPDSLEVLEATHADFDCDSGSFSTSSTDRLEVRIDGSGFVQPFALTLGERGQSRRWSICSQNILGTLALKEI